jgi:hypothetical protein
MFVKSAWKQLLLVGGAAILLTMGPELGITQQNASQPTNKKKIEHQKAFKIYQQKCLSCHDSVADPEKPGRTQDEWLLVVKTMHGYGLGLTADETDLIAGLLYDLRRGMEKDPG